MEQKNGPRSGPFLLVTYRCRSFGRAALWDFYHPCRVAGSAGPVSGRRLVADQASDPALDSAGRVGFGSSCYFLSWEHHDNGSESAPFRKTKSAIRIDATISRSVRPIFAEDATEPAGCRFHPAHQGRTSISAPRNTRTHQLEFRYHHMNIQ
jgi:hypothetical protein